MLIHIINNNFTVLAMSLTLSNKKSLVFLLDSILLPYKFVRIKDDWYLDNNECVSVIGLGKSRYGGQFSIGVAFLLKELNPELLPFPAFYLCNFRQELRLIVPDSKALTSALNLENDVSSFNREQVIVEMLTKYAIPLVLRLDSKKNILLEAQINDNFGPYCRLELKEFVGFN